jgi:hypothetical protein
VTFRHVTRRHGKAQAIDETIAMITAGRKTKRSTSVSEINSAWLSSEAGPLRHQSQDHDRSILSFPSPFHRASAYSSHSSPTIQSSITPSQTHSTTPSHPAPKPATKHTKPPNSSTRPAPPTPLPPPAEFPRGLSQRTTKARISLKEER